jgi:ParB-like chromosome segregation protein Spo0J
LPVTLPETIVRRRCAALIPYARKARAHSDQQVAQIAASIREFGFTNPVLIDEEDGIIAGHGRVLAAHLLGLDEVPCIVLAHLTPAQRRAYVLADNKLALIGSPFAAPVCLWELVSLQPPRVSVSC